ncbi:uncharacterized protein TNCV_3914471 [Trichonephila clavipes]|nr:uncharacterized protein TNCV_3914471 [Trichonephila clavipes]
MHKEEKSFVKKRKEKSNKFSQKSDQNNRKNSANSSSATIKSRSEYIRNIEHGRKKLQNTFLIPRLKDGHVIETLLMTAQINADFVNHPVPLTTDVSTSLVRVGTDAYKSIIKSIVPYKDYDSHKNAVKDFQKRFVGKKGGGPGPDQNVLLKNSEGIEPNRTITSMVLKSTVNDHGDIPQLPFTTINFTKLDLMLRSIRWYNDEAHFWLNGYVNKQNCRIWSEANPQVYVETPLHPENLLFGALYGLVESFFKNDEGLNVTVNGDRYRAMITNFFIPELNNHDVLELFF